MTVRRKTLLVILGVLTVVMGSLFVAARAELIERFWVVEQVRAESHSRAILDDLADQLHSMETLALSFEAAGVDWEHAGDGEARRLHGYLTQRNSAEQYLGVVGPGGTVSGWTSRMGNDLKDVREVAELGEYLRTAGRGVIERGDLTSGIVVLPSAAMMVTVRVYENGWGFVLARHPDTDAAGPAGSVVFSAQEGGGSPGLVESAERWRPGPVAYDASTVIASQQVSDLGGTKVVTITSAHRPVGLQQGSKVIAMLAVALVLAILLCTGITMLLLNRQVVGPLARLVGEIREIGAGRRARAGTFKAEVGEVASTINATLSALEASRGKLEESEARFRGMVDSAPLGVFLTNPEGAAVFTNAQCEAILGVGSDVLCSEGWTRALHPADRERVSNHWKRACGAGGKFREHYRVLHSDGTLRWVTANAAPIYREGVVTGFVGTIEDTTARLQVQEELRRAKTAAEAANLAKSEFLANMSHEIRTPMTAILGYCDVLLEPDLPESERRSSLQTIRRNGEHLLAIINDILDLSRIEAGRANLERVSCSPSQVIAEVLDLLQVRASAKGLSLTVEFEGAIPSRITNDPTKLRQVLINLIGNAIKFTERGGVRVLARTTAWHDGTPRLEISVCDTGIGMSEAQASRLFRPFAQGDSSMSRRYGGTGLGLFISQKLASLMGGSISVASREGEGSTFTLSVDMGTCEGPMLERPVQRAVGAEVGAGEADGRTARLTARVLLAEDGEDNQRLLTHVLKRAGASVTLVDNGRSAVDAALEAERAGRAFDLIIMDMQMPVMDGYAAAGALRGAGYARPIIALTAHAMADDRDKCLRAGCSDYATKPIDRAGFLGMCARWASQVDGRSRAA